MVPRPTPPHIPPPPQTLLSDLSNGPWWSPPRPPPPPRLPRAPARTHTAQRGAARVRAGRPAFQPASTAPSHATSSPPARTGVGADVLDSGGPHLRAPLHDQLPPASRHQVVEHLRPAAGRQGRRSSAAEPPYPACLHCRGLLRTALLPAPAWLPSPPASRAARTPPASGRVSHGLAWAALAR
jgi:hypothetical protein